MSPGAGAGEALFRCHDVSVVHGRGDAAVHALASVNLEIAHGERVAVWGRSGSGKTTLLHVLGGLVAPTSGTVEYEGAELSTLDAAARGRLRMTGISYVFQGANLLPHLTAFENVAFAMAASRSAGADAGEALSLLELVGLAGKADSLPSELSGGESQRVAIARALAQRPQALLCDEPTGHLDSDTGERVLDLIDALQVEFRCALVLATHDADVVARFPRAVELADGQIVSTQAFA